MEPLPHRTDTSDSEDTLAGVRTTRPEPSARRVQSVTCGQCGWPSSCVAQDGLRLLSFVCHWCGKSTVGVVDPSIKRTVIF